MVDLRIIVAFFVVIVTFSETASAVSPPRTVFLAKDFSLNNGQVVTVDGTGIRVTFRTVLEDSRCPVGVKCVWAGNAKVSLEIEGTAAGRTNIILNTELEPRMMQLDAYEIRLISLAPTPREGISIAASEYFATLQVVEK